MHLQQTIVALATPAGPAARMILRTSGPDAFKLAALLGVRALPPRSSTEVVLRFAGLRVGATCYAFSSPRSHTGEDVVEYHLPGNPLLGGLLIESLLRLGARQATPGEFSARAFFNGKLRLDDAEGIAAAIAAGNDRELAAAARLRAGELALRLSPFLEELADLLALCELAIDFSEEDVTVVDPGAAMDRVAQLSCSMARLCEESPRLEQLGRPPRIALAGRANAGKSTLLNALAGRRRAVASDIAGTTRDALEAEVRLAGGPATLVDLAGVADAATGPIDSAAARIAGREAARADVLVLVRDVQDARPDPPMPRPVDLTVLTKIDLAPPPQPPLGTPISAVTGEGLEALRQELGRAAWRTTGGEALALNARHRRHIQLAISHLSDAARTLASGGGTELVALHLREALDALGSILGTVTPDDLLGRIFGQFCIGK